jgi:hypothetical protein
MIKRYSFFILSLIFLAACGTSEPAGPDEQIYGEWTDEIVTYTFLDDLTFEKINLIDNPLDTANLVRTFGNFYSDKENRVISFTIRGFELDNGVILDSSSVGPTWVYKISTDATSQTIMNYQSNTSIGKLVKID